MTSTAPEAAVTAVADISGQPCESSRVDRFLRPADRRVPASHDLLGNGVAGLQRGLGRRLPIYPIKGCSVTFSTQGWNRAPRIPLLDDGRTIGIVPLGDRLCVAGTAEFTGNDLALNARRGAKQIDSLLELFPGLPESECGLDFLNRPLQGYAVYTPIERPSRSA